MKVKHLLLGLLCVFCSLPITKVYGATDTYYAVEFYSDDDFIVEMGDVQWNGIVEYATDDDDTWYIWDGSELNGTSDNSIYLRGKNNTIFTGYDNTSFNFTGKYCNGNIENLLDYEVVQNGGHPEMTSSCFAYMFSDCDNLEYAPDLPATTLAGNCYENMFDNCYNLQWAPDLPATTLASGCYWQMFKDCDSLTQTPDLPATTLAKNCYYEMFVGCDALAQASDLPATILADYCYDGMFYGCENLTQVTSILPCLDLSGLSGRFNEGAHGCYSRMFYNCASLTQAPILPATKLSPYCYGEMFFGCVNLEQIPALPAAILANYCYAGMFDGCTNLKLSETQEEGYPYEYNLGDLELGTNSLNDMFDGTGGTFTGTPEPNKTYYVNFRTISATQTVEITPTLLEIEKKENIPTTSLDDRDKKSDCEVIANVYYAYYVSMPASLMLSPSESENDVYVSEYKVKAKTKTEGLAGKYIKVSPEHSIDLANENNGNTVSLTIEQDKKYFGEESSSKVAKVESDKWVTVNGRVKSTITEQGNYKGNFKFEYGLVDSIE